MRINPDISGAARAPRCIVKVGDTGPNVNMPGWLNVEVTNNNMTSADTFHVSFAASMLPDAYSVDWFSQLSDMYVSIYFGFPADPESYSTADLTQFIYGQVDSIEYDPAQCLIEVSGRDLTRVFIDTRSTQKYPNMTSSQIATNLAIKNGLTPVVTKTTTQVGKYYDIDHVTMTDERSDWELLMYLASLEDFIVYVRNKTLYFGPKPADVSQPVVSQYIIQWAPPKDGAGYATANVQSLSFQRALTVTRGIQVIIRSWNAKQSKGFTSYFPSKGRGVQVGKATPFGGAQVFARTIPNLTQEQADRRAKSLYEQIVQHEMKLTAELPGDVILDTTSVIQVSGTGTAYDQIYYPDSITRRFSWDGGFSMNLSAKNMAPESQANL